MDVWSFGMIMYSLLFGQIPESFYSVYRGWHKDHHDKDVELSTLPFTRPSLSNFIYDPFSIDFDQPFDMDQFLNDSGLIINGSLQEKKKTLNFENFMKCMKGLSYSSLFEEGNSKRFHFKSVAE